MKKHIVIIEDDRNQLRYMSNLLEDAGFVVSRFTSFPSMKELVFMHADCFIVAEWLPKVSGHAICLMLKAKLQTCHIPVMLTSSANHYWQCENLCDADMLLKKPFVGNDLVHAVRSVLTSPEISF